MVTVCKICGKEFNIKPGKVLSHGNCCSRACVKIDNKRKGKNFNCATCGKEFYRAPSRIVGNKTGMFFCSKKCQAAKLNTGGENHPKAGYGGKCTYRKRALEAYGSVCAKCGYSKYEIVLDVHHIDKDRKNNKVDNLVVLCPTCHMELHRLKWLKSST